MVCPWGFPLSVRSGRNQRARHRHEVNTRRSRPSLFRPGSGLGSSNALSFCSCCSAQLFESVGSCLWCTGAPCPAEGAIGLFYRSAIQGHRERSHCYLIFDVNYSWGRLTIAWVSIIACVEPMPLLWQLCNLYLDLNNHACLISVETGDFLNCEGSGLFLLQSSCKCRWSPCCERCHFSSKAALMTPRPLFFLSSSTPAGNHSCIPNAEASFPDNNFLLQLSALSDIHPGEVSWHVWVRSDRFRHRTSLSRFACSLVSWY